MTVTRAFDRLAPTYDVLAGGEAFLHQRRQTHAAFTRWLRPGCRVLEIGCGTGVDTEFLATAGLRVIACDPSEEMLIRTQRRLARTAAGDRATTLSCGLEDLPRFLDGLDGGEGFDAVVSNFGALNCVRSLAPLGAIARRHLRPGGAIVLGLMGRACLWESCYFAARGRPSLMARRRQPDAVVPVAGVDVPTFYHRTREVREVLGAGFALDQVLGVGVVVPPPYLEARWQQVPAPIRRFTAGLDCVVSSWPIVNQLGDHILTRWVKRREVQTRGFKAEGSSTGFEHEGSTAGGSRA
jgi:ubiquinone/menaquinone biosynthesis C-methylase UbiE